MKTNDLLARVKIASPCTARWDDMTGDDRSRFCHLCRKHVYNFSAMAAGEAADLIRAKEGQLCGRFYQRADGTMLTSNCPIGVERVFRWIKTLVAATLTAVVTSFGIYFAGVAVARAPSETERSKFGETVDEVVWRIKAWFGLNAPMAKMGVICIAPGPAVQTPLTTDSKSTEVESKSAPK